METEVSAYAKELAENLVIRYPGKKGRHRKVSDEVRRDFEIIFEWHFAKKLNNELESGAYMKRGKNLIIYSYHVSPEKVLPYFKEIFRQLPKLTNGQRYGFKKDVFLRFKILYADSEDVKMEVRTEGLYA